MGAVKAKIEPLAATLDNVNARIEQQKKKLGELKASYNTTFNADKKSKLQEQILATEAALIKLEKTSDDTARKIWALEDSAKGAEVSFRDLSESLKQAGLSSSKIADIERSLKSANPAILRGQLAEITAQMKALGATDEDIAKVTRELENSAKGASGLSKEMKALGVAYGALAAAMTVVIKNAVESSRTFEQAMANVKAISQATGAEFAALREQALALGSATLFTASQTADAQALLAQAGMKTNDIIAAMPGLLSGAAAGQTDLATTADIVASALNGFQLSAEETNRVVDVLAKSSIDTNADLTDLGMALKYVAPIAASMGISIEEAVAAIGELSNAGIKGEMAGTQLRAMLLALSSPSEEAALYMKQLGVNISDASGKILPLGNIVGQLEGAFKRLTQAQQADVAATLVGREAASGFITIISQGRGTLDGYTASLQNAGGTAEAVADTQMDTLNGAIIQMQSALEGVGITVGDMFAPAIRQVAETITKALAGFNELNPALQAAIVALPTAAVGVMGLVTAVYALRAAFIALNISFPILGAISLAIGAVVAGLSALSVMSNATAESVKKHDEAQKSLNETLNKSPIERSVEDVQALKEKTEELIPKLEERAKLEKRLNEILDQGDVALQRSPELLGELQEINEKLMIMDKQINEMGFDSFEDAEDKARLMKEQIEASIPALHEMEKAELAGVAAKVQHIDKVNALKREYDDLNSAEKLSEEQKVRLNNVVRDLVKDYPSLNAQLDEENRWHITNKEALEKIIKAEEDSVTASAQASKDRLTNWKTETEAKLKLANLQIKALEKVEKFSFADTKLGKALPGESAKGIEMIGDMVLRGVRNNVQNNANQYQADIIDFEKEIQSITVGAFDQFTNGSSGSGITLGKEKSAKSAKEKKGKSAAELAAEARKKAYDAELKTIQFQADMYEWSTDRQIESYEKLRTRHEKFLKESVDDRRTLDLQIKRLGEESLQAQYDFSAEWIKQEERRMEDSGKSEEEIAQMKISAWTRVRDRYVKDSAQYKAADEQLYQVRKSLTQQTLKLTDNLVKTEKSRIEDVKKAEIAAIKKRKEAALDDYDARIKAIDELMAKEAEYNSDVDYETALREKNARIDELASAVGPEGIAEREQAIKDRDRMILEHERELRKRELESQKDALKDEKDAQADAFDKEISATEAQFDALVDAFNSYSGDIKTIEAILAQFRVSEAGKANAQILTELDSFVAQYNAKMATVTSLSSANDLTEYNANKDAWSAAKSRGDTAEMARLTARNEELRKLYGIAKDTGKLQSFAVGGIVRGQNGEPVIAQVHAGEMVLNARQQAVLFEALSGVSSRPVSQPSGAITQITNHIDMGVGAVTLEDQADIRALYDERARTVERLQTQGVKTLG